MIIDDGTYNTFFDIPDNITNFTIKSASGNAYKYARKLPLYYSSFYFICFIIHCRIMLISSTVASLMDKEVLVQVTDCHGERESCTLALQEHSSESDS